MSLLLCFLISIAVNLDNFLIGINLGLKHRRLTLFSNIMIAAMTAITTFAAALITWLISDTFVVLSSAFGAVFLILFGIFCLLQNDNDEALADKYQELTLRKSVLLGLVLSVNCIPPAFSAGMLEISPPTIGIFTGIFSFLCMYLSNRFGTFFRKFKITQKLTPISYGILIITGFIEIVILI